jgi:hypothetical protein
VVEANIPYNSCPHELTHRGTVGNLRRRRNMMRTLCSKLLVLVVVTILATALQPSTLSAQTSGVGSDGLTRLLWRGTDGKISVWRIHTTLNTHIFHEYGPFPGWTPIALTVDAINRTYVLWRHSNGTGGLWRLDGDLNLTASIAYGPFDGWTLKSMSVNHALNIDPGEITLRLIWRHSDGRVSLWIVNGESLEQTGYHEYGPFFGWDPGPVD